MGHHMQAHGLGPGNEPPCRVAGHIGRIVLVVRIGAPVGVMDEHVSGGESTSERVENGGLAGIPTDNELHLVNPGQALSLRGAPRIGFPEPVPVLRGRASRLGVQ